MSICVFGDSIAWGAYDPTHGGWVTLLRNHIEREWEKFNNISLYNLGINGDTSSGVLTRLHNEISTHSVYGLQGIIYAVGVNDSAKRQETGDNWVPYNVFQKNIQSLHLQGLSYTDKIMFIGLTSVVDSLLAPYPGDPDKTYTQTSVDRYDQVIREYCRLHKVAYVPLPNINLCNDGLHPNTQGHQKIFELVRPIVEQMLTSGA